MFGLFKRTPEVEPPLPDLPLVWTVTDVSERGPRPARFTRTTRMAIWVLRAASVATIALGIPLVLSFASNTENFARKGEVVQAEVIDTSVQKGKSTTYRVTYSYPTGAGYVTDNESISYSEYSSLYAGGTVPVTVLGEARREHRYGIITVEDARRQQLAGSLIVMAISLGFGAAAHFYRKAAETQVVTLRDWNALPAQAIRLQSRSAGKSGTTHEITYRLRRDNGSIDEFSDSETGHKGPRAIPGDTFTVMVNPASENDVKPLWGLGMVEVAAEGTPVDELHS